MPRIDACDLPLRVVLRMMSTDQLQSLLKIIEERIVILDEPWSDDRETAIQQVTEYNLITKYPLHIEFILKGRSAI